MLRGPQAASQDEATFSSSARYATGSLTLFRLPLITGKTRTKDKYRVVYSDHQRLELEKEFHYSRYITIRRKAELAASLGLSERQVTCRFSSLAHMWAMCGHCLLETPAGSATALPGHWV